VILSLVPIATIPTIYAQTEFDTTSMGLQMPTITMSPSSGQPGTEVEIKVTKMPPVPDNTDPRVEFFVYLPFVSAIGSNVPNNCDGASCFALYSFEEIGQDKLAPKTITFTLFSTTNKVPVTQAGLRESVCDLKVNGETIERYSETCTDIDQPVGDYEIKFGWGIQSSDLFDIRETLTFTVLEKQFVLEVQEQDKDELLMEQLLAGEISEKEFNEKFAELGYDEEEIRQSKALIGYLPHQDGARQAPKPVPVDGSDFQINYLMSEGMVTQISPDKESKSLFVKIDSISNGTLTINLPREVIDAKFGGEDDEFFVVIDGEEVSFDETKAGKERTLTIGYPAGSEEIEIIGTFVIPEFGTIAMIILMISIMAVIFTSKSKLGFYTKTQ
jgi:predicted secreted protein with PEFG-CTERM motif